jgi:hypothetical protein
MSTKTERAALVEVIDKAVDAHIRVERSVLVIGVNRGWRAAKEYFGDDREQLRYKIESLIAEFGDHPALCLGVIIEYLTIPKGEHSINADGSCNLGCC